MRLQYASKVWTVQTKSNQSKYWFKPNQNIITVCPNNVEIKTKSYAI